MSDSPHAVRQNDDVTDKNLKLLQYPDDDYDGHRSTTTNNPTLSSPDSPPDSPPTEAKKDSRVENESRRMVLPELQRLGPQSQNDYRQQSWRDRHPPQYNNNERAHPNKRSWQPPRFTQQRREMTPPRRRDEAPPPPQLEIMDMPAIAMRLASLGKNGDDDPIEAMAHRFARDVLIELAPNSEVGRCIEFLQKVHEAVACTKQAKEFGSFMIEREKKRKKNE